MIILLLFFFLLLQQPDHIVTSTGPNRVTSSIIYHFKAQGVKTSKLHDAISRSWGENFYGPSKSHALNIQIIIAKSQNNKFETKMYWK